MDLSSQAQSCIWEEVAWCRSGDLVGGKHPSQEITVSLLRWISQSQNLLFLLCASYLSSSTPFPPTKT